MLSDGQHLLYVGGKIYFIQDVPTGGVINV